jgi:hypothetical protein
MVSSVAAAFAPVDGPFGVGAAGLAASAGLLSTGLAGVSALAYYAGGDFKDGNTNLFVAGVGVATGGMGDTPARLLFRSTTSNASRFAAKGVIVAFGKEAAGTSRDQGIVGFHFAVPGTLFGATSIVGNWNSDPGGDW